MPFLSERQFAELMREMPNASEEEVLAEALRREGVPPPHIPLPPVKGPGPIPDPTRLQFDAIDRANRARLEPLITPLYRPTYAPDDQQVMEKEGAPVRVAGPNSRANTLKGAAEAMSTPDNLVGLAMGPASNLARKVGAYGVSKGARLLDAAASAVPLSQGVGMALDPDSSVGERVMGAGMAALGARSVQSAVTGAFEPRAVRDAYLRAQGRPIVEPPPVKGWDEDLAKRTADAYEAMPHAPHDPDVRASYDALGEELERQYDFITRRAGVKVQPSTVAYPNSAAMVADVTGHNRLNYFPTTEGFGDGGITDNPLLRISAKYGVPQNDLLRAVHDYFGHADGLNEFGKLGERRAFGAHRVMLPRNAVPALATETHGQNSWVNAGRHLRRADGSLPVKGDPDYISLADRPYAAQKAGLLPPHIIDPPEYRWLDSASWQDPANNPLTRNEPYTVVTAANPPNHTFTDAENAARQADLAQVIRTRTFHHPIPAQGMFQGTPEPSWLVPGMDREAALKVGATIQPPQHSIITEAGVHRFGDDAWFPTSGPPVVGESKVQEVLATLPPEQQAWTRVPAIQTPEGPLAFRATIPPQAWDQPAPRSSSAGSESASLADMPSASPEDSMRATAQAPAGTLIGPERQLPPAPPIDRTQVDPLLHAMSDERLRLMQGQGYDTSKVWMHGSPDSSIQSFRPSTGETQYGPGVYLTNEPNEAHLYARQGAIYPVIVRDSPRIEQQLPTPDWLKPILTGAGVEPWATAPKHAVVSNPSHIRSIWAAFDPTKRDSANILATLGPLLAVAGSSPEAREYLAQMRQQLGAEVFNQHVRLVQSR